MKVSLNKANKLRNAVSALQVPLAGIVEFRSDVGIDKQRVEEVKNEFTYALDCRQMKIAAEHFFREAIHNKNQDVGINSIIGEIASYERSIRDLSNSLSSISVVRQSSPEDAQAALDFENERNKLKPELAQAPRKISIFCLSKQESEKVRLALEKKIKEAKFEIEELKEKRNDLNHKTIIELPEAILLFLRDFGLLKA